MAPSQSYWLPETQPVQRLDYDNWGGLLRAHVRRGNVDYPAIAGDGGFPAFLAALRRARFTSDTTAAQRLAFWINAYNAAAIAGILAGRSPATLLGRAEFFWRTRYDVGGEAITSASGPSATRASTSRWCARRPPVPYSRPRPTCRVSSTPSSRSRPAPS